ncbi:hypothetical protein [Saccharopolyspora phatthalungensis]|uniref:Regulator of replication initiation timing n=1 Tax=Saccharopolyspora phatthalungensis TaxID=664693 RepID=A0A840Q191_9PSEU|nr:hypothetical protein [Saccharopolyspora phatthalungensis]MBB5153730.1 regulator of replication initiation timing [Saccharopolyspora phatthalungensis]
MPEDRSFEDKVNRKLTQGAVSKEEGALAKALIGLYDLLKKQPGKKLDSTAKRLGISSSALYRGLTCDSFPSWEMLVKLLYESACDDAGRLAVGTTDTQLKGLYSAAEAAHRKRRKPRCSACPEYRRNIRSLQQQVLDLQQKVSELLQEAQALRADKAVLDAALTVQHKSAHLPVPSRKGDRQRSTSDTSAATQLAAEVATLFADGQREAALAVLREIPGLLTPRDSAASVALLRRQELDKPAETLIQIYSREQPEKDVMRFALGLQEFDLANDAGNALRIAVG